MNKGIVLVAGLGMWIGLTVTSQAAVPESLSGAIKVDGSSTVYPITEAVAEDFGKQHRGVKVTVGISGTGGGFKKFCAGETDISDASRPIKPTEVELCQQNKIEYVELPVAYDALTVVVNPKNTWVSSMTVAELKKIWEPAAQGKITNWNQINPAWPNKPLKLFAPGVDSGTYDYFTEAIVGKEDMSRGDYTASEDDNVLVQGVASEEGGLGFFGLAYYEENLSKLKAIAINDGDDSNGKGAIMPSMKSVISGEYKPLARPLFIYVRKDSAQRPLIKEFVKYYLDNAPVLTAEVGYVPLQKNVYALATSRFNKQVVGSLFHNNTQVGATLEQLLAKHNT